jgi:hypothetical protein
VLPGGEKNATMRSIGIACPATGIHRQRHRFDAHQLQALIRVILEYQPPCNTGDTGQPGGAGRRTIAG